MMEIWWNLPTRLCLCNKNPHCFRECLRTPTRTAKYCVNSLRSFIRSSLEHIRSVIQKTTMLILTLVANLSNGVLLKTTFALLCISHSHFTKCLPFRDSVVDFWGGGPRWPEEWTERMGFGWWFWLTDIIDRNAWNHHQYEYDNSVDSALRQTQRYDSERHQDLLGKAILCVNFKLL